ncbi:hypothetical protein LTR56_014631 [Elasticomyces elasticus]|nr:hypothetical protein LTR56_014631 [Elasticomyces elasticus]KAK3645308.1 hypothetical protein LTR22_014773 [Elasticomyces elasticus]KAK4919850.1 hypothetical protein LTR49_012597 [Elasticomyces elasticus]KAK5752887.1 hypothetical protein LTS12_017058 [Elasticomyces elasticus]
MEYHTSFDPLDSWDIINDLNWVENAIARDLQDPAVALPYEVEQLSGNSRYCACSQNLLERQSNMLRPVCYGQLLEATHSTTGIVARSEDRKSPGSTNIGETASCSGLDDPHASRDWNTWVECVTDFTGANATNYDVVTTGSLPEAVRNPFITGINDGKDVSAADYGLCVGDAGTGRQNSGLGSSYGATSPVSFGMTPLMNDNLSSQVASTSTIICYHADDAPTGRQHTKTIQCGICMSKNLFDRKHELQRHMALHFPGQYPCLQTGCAFTGARAFRRADKLVKHKREAHGL